MRKNQPSSLLNRLLNSKALIIVELCVVLFFTVAVVKEISRRWEINQEVKKLHAQIESAQGKSTELSGLISYFQSDYYQEKEARLKLGLQKEGEQAITIPGLRDSATTSASVPTYLDTAVSDTNTSIPSKWWDYFFKKTN